MAYAVVATARLYPAQQMDKIAALTRSINSYGREKNTLARVFQRVKKVLSDFFARFKNAKFFVKFHFTKNLAMLVKKPDKSGIFDGYLSNSRWAAAPSSSPRPSLHSMHSFLVL